MGSWDYYCVFCGSTFTQYHINEKPRSNRFKRARRLSEANKRIENLTREGKPIPEELQREVDQNEDSGPDGDDQDSAEDEENSYDPDIITPKDAMWICNLQCLGLNPDSPSLSKGFISGVGVPGSYGAVEVEAGDDPNFPEDDNLSAYSDTEDRPVYPFHSKCWDLFRITLARKRSMEDPISIDGRWLSPSLEIDKDILFHVFNQRSEEGANRLLDIDYGEPDPPSEQYWWAQAGEEIFLADPTQDSVLVKSIILNSWNLLDSRSTDSALCRPQLETNDKIDAFAKLPYELLMMVIFEIDFPTLINLSIVSPQVRYALKGNNSFWMDYTHKTMPWFFELHELLGNLRKLEYCHSEVDSDASMPSDKMHRFYLWANHITTPRIGKAGPFLGISNRRRVWGVCQQLNDPYIVEIESFAVEDLDKDAAKIRDNAVCSYMPVVSHPYTEKGRTERSFWVQSWADISSGSTLKMFWSPEKSLVGLGVSISGKDQLRNFGFDDSRIGTSSMSMKIDRGDWISGFILYYPKLVLSGYSHDLSETSVVGITVLLRSGIKESFGSTSPDNVQLPLLPSKDMVIVGVAGYLESVNSKMTKESVDRITRIGLIQCAHGAVAFNAPRPAVVESMAWTHDCTRILTQDLLESLNQYTSLPRATRTASTFGIPIWDLPCLNIQFGVGRPKDLVAHEPLIWAKDTREALALNRLTGYVSSHGPNRGRGTSDLRGIRSSYTPEANIRSRKIGFSPDKHGTGSETMNCVDMNLDGANGEIISAVCVAHDTLVTPSAIKLITNRGQEIRWGLGDFPARAPNTRTLVAPEGHMIIGIVISFARAGGWDDELKVFDPPEMSSVAVLTLPII